MQVKQQNRQQVRVSIAILNFSESPDIVTELLTVQPTKTRSTVDRAQISNKNIWILESSVKSSDVEAHITHLISQLKEWPKLFLSLGHFDCVVRCMMEIDENTTTTLNLSVSTLEILAKMKCSFDLDYYYLGK